jgi:hypothetical protein
LADIYLLLFIFLVIWYFIYLRKIAESARKQAIAYCENKGLQYIAVARRSSRLQCNKELGVFWRSIFDLEFSGDGESSYQGEMTLHGLKMIAIDLPAYRIDANLH